MFRLDRTCVMPTAAGLEWAIGSDMRAQDVVATRGQKTARAWHLRQRMPRPDAPPGCLREAGEGGASSRFGRKACIMAIGNNKPTVAELGIALEAYVTRFQHVSFRAEELHQDHPDRFGS